MCLSCTLDESAIGIKHRAVYQAINTEINFGLPSRTVAWCKQNKVFTQMGKRKVKNCLSLNILRPRKMSQAGCWDVASTSVKKTRSDTLYGITRMTSLTKTVIGFLLEIFI